LAGKILEVQQRLMSRQAAKITSSTVFPELTWSKSLYMSTFCGFGMNQ
jgi:hypothetical protein